jgi:hypothetical protein
MTKRRESELQIVEVKESLARTKLPGPIRPPQRRPAPTRAEALKAIRAAKGADSVIARVPALGQIGVWVEVASWNACQATGAADDLPFLWGCDFPGASWDMLDGSANCLPFFAGSDNALGITPPGNNTRQVWCYLNAPVNGLYLFVVQVESYVVDVVDPNYTATIECLIDSDSPYPLGVVTIPVNEVVNKPFLVSLPTGQYKFVIAQVSGAFFFQNLTAWIVPEIRNPPSL